MAASSGAGPSFKVQSATNQLTEIAPWFTSITPSEDISETVASTFNPGSTIPTTRKLFGSVTRSLTLEGFWDETVQAFFRALSGQTFKAFEWAPKGTAVGNVRMFGSLNVGPWPMPRQSATGTLDVTLELAVNDIESETIITPPATIAITSSSVANPTVLTTAAHGITVGLGDVVVIAGHTGSTPDINGAWYATALTSTTLSIPVSVTVGGTGGTLQK
jgi:hypothetical protein